MKKYLISSLLVAGAGLLCACSADDANGIDRPSTRTITVNCPETRTTIAYEGSDYSHLVWNDGDAVVYATDTAGDTFKTATVTENRFAAEVPAGAGADTRLLVVWPGETLAGGMLASASASLSAEIEQVTGAPFDGSLLPMYADLAVPEDRDQVDALYNMLGSVVRIRIDGTNHESETLESVTLTAHENLVGRYTFDVASRAWSFSGSGNTVTVTMTGEKALLADRHSIYMVVDPASYTGVTVTVQTDADSYVYADGKMDLAQPGRTLYRIDVALDEQVEPVIPWFTQVVDVAEITADGTYLIVTDHSATQCYATGAKSMTYLTPVALDLTPEGIRQTAEVMKHTWKIEKQESGMFSLFSNELNQFVGAPGAIIGNDYGKFWFTAAIADDPDQQLIYHWDITVDAPQATVKSRRMEDCYFMYKGADYVDWFCPCTSQTNGAKPIRIFKMRE